MIRRRLRGCTNFRKKDFFLNNTNLELKHSTKIQFWLNLEKKLKSKFAVLNFEWKVLEYLVTGFEFWSSLWYIKTVTISNETAVFKVSQSTVLKFDIWIRLLFFSKRSLNLNELVKNVIKSSISLRRFRSVILFLPKKGNLGWKMNQSSDDDENTQVEELSFESKNCKSCVNSIKWYEHQF